MQEVPIATAARFIPAAECAVQTAHSEAVMH